MATFYGEIVPATSRAVGESEDEEDVLDEPHTKVSLSWNENISEYIKDFKFILFGIGSLASAFIQSFVLRDEGCDFGRVYLESAAGDKKGLCNIYRLQENSEILVVLCANVTAEDSYNVVTQVLSPLNISQANALIINVEPTRSFRSRVPVSELLPPFARSVKTLDYADIPLFPPLEPPNIILGLPAQLMTYFRVHHIPAILYCCYSDHTQPNMAVVSLFKKLIECSRFGHLFTEPHIAETKLRKLVWDEGSYSTIYT